MTFKLACGDVMPGCATRFESPDKAELLRQVSTHAAADHGITTITPEVRQAIESRVTSSA